MRQISEAPRRTRLRAEERRHLLLEAAVRTFGRAGIDGARMEDVAAEAGVATGLLYRHFESKDALVEALMQARTAEFECRLQTRIGELEAADTPTWQLVTEGLEMWVDQVSQEITDFKWITASEPEPCQAYRHHILGFVADQIRAVAPSVDEQTAWLVASALGGVAESVSTEWRDQARSVPQEQLLHLLSVFCLGGLSALARDLGVDVALSPSSGH
jgi:AcrR family transcriptional regulator